MPEDAAVAGIPPVENMTAPREVKPDRVGEELADDARIWRIYDPVSKQEDDERVQTWNRGFDKLALFATLFSAVTTAFLLEARDDMKPDYAQLSFLVLNATNYGDLFVQEPFVIPTTARTINGLWTASLILSLLASLISVMGKEWLTMYTSRPDCNPRQWAEIRTYRARCIEQWYMPQIVASAQPLLLHASFVLFLAGLVLFISPDPFTQHLTLGLCVFAGFLYLVTALSAIVFPASPFRSPATQMIRGAIAALMSPARDFLLYHPRRNLVANVHAAVIGIIAPDLAEISRRQRHFLRTIHQFPSLLRTAWQFVYSSVRRAFRHMRPANIASMARRHRISHLIFGSPWTDIHSRRSPKRLATALSWLSSASEAPEVLHGLLLALGDLEIGGKVAPLVSADLRTRVRADIRLNWEKVDFYTLSRYVLAEHGVLSARCLHVQLCHSHSLLTDDDKLILIHRLLGEAALPWIQHAGDATFDYFEYPSGLECCVDILTAIVHLLLPLLQQPDTLHRGEELFGLLVHSETLTRDGSSVVWDLGSCLRELSARIPAEPSIAGAIRRLLSELKALYPLSHDSAALLPHWSRICLPAVIEDWTYDNDDELVAFFATRTRGIGNEHEKGEVAAGLGRAGGGGRDTMWWLDARRPLQRIIIGSASADPAVPLYTAPGARPLLVVLFTRVPCMSLVV